MTTSTQALSETLRSLVSGDVRPAQAADIIAGVRAQLVVEPANEAEVARVLAFASNAELKVLPRGGGSQLGHGLPPSGGDILLSLRRLNAVIEHAPHDQTVSVQAGITLRDLQTHLSQSRQWLALDPVLDEAATIGGIIAANASGARRLRYGGVRDQIIGVRIALADGTLASGGGKVVKNVAGYDLPKLFTGSLGTLGVIVAATFRLYPLPAATRTVTFTAPSPDPLCALVLRANASTLVPAASDIFGPASADSACTLAMRFESGLEIAVGEQAQTLIALAGDLGTTAQTLAGDTEADFWRNADVQQRETAAKTATSPSYRRHPGGPDATTDEDAAKTANDSPSPRREKGAGGGASLALRVSLLPGQIAPWLERLRTVAAEHNLETRWRAHAGHGLLDVWLSGADDALLSAMPVLREAALAQRGSLVVLDSAPSLAGRVDVWGQSGALDVMRRLKASFDPHATLNPGRFIGGI